MRIAAAGSRPLSLDLARGEPLTVHNPRRSRRMFDWILGDSPDPLPVTAEDGLILFTHDGQRIALRPISTDFFTFGEVFVRDVYQINAMQAPLSNIVDIGANVGLFAIRVAAIADRVIAVEPVEDNLKVARKNVALSKMEDKITLHQHAVTGESRQTVRIFLSNRNHGGHSVCQEHAAQWGATSHGSVPAISLSDLFDRHGLQRCSLLKCDVEGSEFEIFRTAGRELLGRIDKILMEVHFTTGDWNSEQFNALVGKLGAAGFSVRHEPVLDHRGKLKPVVMLFATNGEASA